MEGWCRLELGGLGGVLLLEYMEQAVEDHEAFGSYLRGMIYDLCYMRDEYMMEEMGGVVHESWAEGRERSILRNSRRLSADPPRHINIV